MGLVALMFSLRKQVLAGGYVLLWKVLSVAFSLLTVRLSLDLLGKDLYGSWVVVFSIISWFKVFDLGIASSLRSSVKRLSKEHTVLAIVVESIRKLSRFVIPLILLLVLISTQISSINKFFPEIFKSIDYFHVYVFLGIYSFLIVRILMSVFLGMGIHHFENLIDAIYNIVLAFFLILLDLSFEQYVILALFTPLIITAIFFTTNHKFSLKSVGKRKKIKLKSSNSFLIIQMAALVLFSTDYLLAKVLFSNKEVVDYFLINKYFSVVLMISTSMATALWAESAGINRVNLSEQLRKMIAPQLYLIAILVILVIFMIVFHHKAIELWVNQSFNNDVFLSSIIALNIIMIATMTPFTMIINGLEYLQIQKLTSLISIIINIPLSILLSDSFGIAGIPMATSISIVYGLIARPLQIYMIIKGKKGIWTR